MRQRRANLGCIATEFRVTWYSNCLRYWAANTNNSTVFIMCVTPEATTPGHRSTTLVCWNTVHVSKSAFAESPSSVEKTLIQLFDGGVQKLAFGVRHPCTVTCSARAMVKTHSDTLRSTLEAIYRCTLLEAERLYL